MILTARYRKMLLTLLLFAVILPIFTASSNADGDEAPAPAYFDIEQSVETIKVGINSGYSALWEAKLLNKTGSGYAFGYFDYTRVFHDLGYTACTALSMRGDVGFVLPDDTKVGPYHMLLNDIYGSFDEAKSVADGLWGGFPGYINGQYRVLVGAYANESKTYEAINKRGMDAQAFTGSEFSILAAETDTSELQFLYDNGQGTKLAVRPVGADKPETWFGGDFYCGNFEYVRSGSRLTVINYVNAEDYVKGVLPYEMSGQWPLETLKAQAVCARTYVMNNINAYSDDGFDVRNDTYSQVYRGAAGATEITNIAAESTSGKLVRYRGAVCKVYYMSSDGGSTDSGENVFSQRRSYLLGVADPYEKDIEFYNKTWKSELKPESIVSRLSGYGYELAEISEISTVYSDMGNVIELEIKDMSGNAVNISGEDCFRKMGLNSLHYSVSKQTVDDETMFVFEGGGWGHNCGMSQWGAYSMAYNYGADCNKIIDFYFNGAYIA